MKKLIFTLVILCSCIGVMIICIEGLHKISGTIADTELLGYTINFLMLCVGIMIVSSLWNSTIRYLSLLIFITIAIVPFLNDYIKPEYSQDTLLYCIIMFIIYTIDREEFT